MGKIEQIPTYTIGQNDSLDGIFRLFQFKGQDLKNDALPQAPFPTDLPHRHNFYEIFIIVEGFGIHSIDFENHDIVPNSVHLVSPGQTHIMEKGKKCSGYILVFNKEFITFYFRRLPDLLRNSFLQRNGIPPIVKLNSQNFKELMDALHKMKIELKKDGQTSYDLICCYLNIILLRLYDQFKAKIVTEKKVGANEVVIQFKDALEKNFIQYHLVRDYANLLNITPKKLNRICRTNTGKSASDHIVDRIILEAKRNLVFSTASSKEVAYLLNYKDPSYFSRLFKKKTGLSPSEFRNTFTEKYQ